MEKLSLFDLLSFAIPGGATMAILYWATINITDMRLGTFQLPAILGAALLLMIAYFLGHIINELGQRFEKKRIELHPDWVTHLEADPLLKTELNAASEKLFKQSFLDGEGKTERDAGGRFYDNAFHMLEVEDKLEKIRILQSQYVFFRNAVVVSWIGGLAFAAVAVTIFFKTRQWYDPICLFSAVGMIFCVWAAKNCARLSIKRRKMKMKATLYDFYAYYLTKTQFK